MSKRSETKSIYRIVSAPLGEDEPGEPLPWDYEEDGLIAWVDEVFLEGYKHDDAPVPSVEECLEILESAGYRVEVING